MAQPQKLAPPPLLRGGYKAEEGGNDEVKTSGGRDRANFISLNSHFIPPLPHKFKSLLVDPKTEPQEGILNIPFVLRNMKESCHCV